MRKKGAVDLVTVRKCDWRTFISATDKAEPETTEGLDLYFSYFVQPEFMPELNDKGGPIFGSQSCIGCGEMLVGSLVEILTGEGGFEWGLVHGWGHCRKCRYPVALYHFVKDTKGEDILTLRGVYLQVHPSNLAIDWNKWERRLVEDPDDPD